MVNWTPQTLDNRLQSELSRYFAYFHELFMNPHDLTTTPIMRHSYLCLEFLCLLPRKKSLVGHTYWWSWTKRYPDCTMLPFSLFPTILAFHLLFVSLSSQIQMRKTWISWQEKMWKSLTKKIETLMSQTSLGIQHQRLMLIIFPHTIISVPPQD